MNVVRLVIASLGGNSMLKRKIDVLQLSNLVVDGSNRVLLLLSLALVMIIACAFGGFSELLSNLLGVQIVLYPGLSMFLGVKELIEPVLILQLQKLFVLLSLKHFKSKWNQRPVDMVIMMMVVVMMIMTLVRMRVLAPIRTRMVATGDVRTIDSFKFKLLSFPSWVIRFPLLLDILRHSG